MTRLAKDRKEAHDLWHEKRAEEKPDDKPGADHAGVTVQRAIAEFLTWLDNQPKKSERTRKWYRGWLVGRWTKKDGSKLPASPTAADLKDAIPHKRNNAFGPYVKLLKIRELKKSHIESWLADKLKKAKNNGRLGGLKAVRRFVRWAMDEGYIRLNPMKGIEMPAYEPRDGSPEHSPRHASPQPRDRVGLTRSPENGSHRTRSEAVPRGCSNR